MCRLRGVKPCLWENSVGTASGMRARFLRVSFFCPVIFWYMSFTKHSSLKCSLHNFDVRVGVKLARPTLCSHCAKSDFFPGANG